MAAFEIEPPSTAMYFSKYDTRRYINVIFSKGPYRRYRFSQLLVRIATRDIIVAV